MSEYWSGNVTFAGFSTGTDFNSIIDATVKQEKYRYNQLEKVGAETEFKKEQVTGLNNTLMSYKKRLESMDTVEEFLVKKVSSSETSIVTATAKSGAEEGTHTIVVESLASTGSVTSGKSVSALTDTVSTTGTATTFTFTYGKDDSNNPVEYVIDVPADMTYTQLMEEIESATNGNVKARAIDTGSGLRVQLRGMDLGADYSIELNADATALFADPTDPADPAHVEIINTAATDAKFTVDGVEITRQKNTIDDVISNVTLNLNDADKDKTITVKVETDYDAVVKNVEDFVKLTNELREGFKLVREYENEELDKKNINYSLKTNPQIKNVESRLSRVLTTTGVGFANDGGPSSDSYTSLSMLGIKTVADQNDQNFGKLEFDQDIMSGDAFTKNFMDLLKEDPEGVAQIFAANGEGVSSDTSTITYGSSLLSMGVTKPGTYEIEYPGDAATANDTITINGKTGLVDYDAATGVVTVTSGDAKGLTFSIVDNSVGPHSAILSVKQGKVQETISALDEITDTETGSFVILTKGYTKEIEENEKKMASELKRVESLEKRLIQQYAVTETRLGQYQNIQAMLEFQLKSQLAQDD